jgi:hypothetical protein
MHNGAPFYSKPIFLSTFNAIEPRRVIINPRGLETG